MTGAPDSTPEPVQHRRRHSNAWKRTPTIVKVAIAVCLVALVVASLLLQRKGTKAPPPPPSMSKTFDTLVARFPKMDLVLSKSSLNLSTRSIEGVLTNASAHAYANVEISFFIMSRDQTSSEIRTATVARIAPHGNAPFATLPVDKGMDDWSMQGIKATPANDVPVAGKGSPPAPER